MREELDARTVAGLFSGALLVSVRGVRVIEGRGTANVSTGEMNTPATRFNTASLTKLFTAVATCRLFESEPAAFDRPVSAWLAHDISIELGVLTSRQLLVHTSGLPEQVPDEPGGVIGPGWLAPLRGVHLDFVPGSDWQYSNVGYSLLGAVIERVTGQPYFEAVRDLVFTPVGMTSTSFADTTNEEPGRAVGYAFAPGQIGFPSEDARGAGLGRGAPYGYAFSTVSDMERLLRAVAAHEIASASIADQILTGFVRTASEGRYAGFGLFVDELPGLRITTSSGAGPGISAWLDFLPDDDYTAIVLSNNPKPSAHGMGEFLRHLVLGAAA